MVISNKTFGQHKLLEGIFISSGYYGGVILNFNSDLTFTLSYRGHVSSDTAAGSYKIDGNKIYLKYDYNNYEKIFALYKSREEEVPIDILLSASQIVLRPEILLSKRNKLFAINKINGSIKT